MDSACGDEKEALTEVSQQRWTKYRSNTKRLCTALASLADALPEASRAFNLLSVLEAVSTSESNSFSLSSLQRAL